MVAEVTAAGGLVGVGNHAAPLHADLSAGQVLGEQAAHVVVDDDDLVHGFLHLLGEQAHSGGAAADAHPGLGDAVDDGSLAGLGNDLDHAVLGLDAQLHLLAVGQLHDGTGHHEAVGAGQAVGAAHVDHLGAVLLGGDHAHHLAAAVDGIAFLADVGVGVQLHGNGGVAQRSLGHDGDHLHAVTDVGDDVRGGTDAGIVGARAHSGDDGTVQLGIMIGDGIVVHHQSAVADQFAVLVGIALAGAGVTHGNMALDRAGRADNALIGGCLGALNRAEFTNAGADAALGAFFFTDDRLAVHDMDSIKGAVLLAQGTALASFQVHNNHGCWPPSFFLFLFPAPGRAGSRSENDF